MISQYVLLNSAENCLSTHICCQKKVFMIYVVLVTKPQNYKKKRAFMIYVTSATKPQNYKKKYS